MSIEWPECLSFSLWGMFIVSWFSFLKTIDPTSVRQRSCGETLDNTVACGASEGEVVVLLQPSPMLAVVEVQNEDFTYLVATPGSASKETCDAGQLGKLHWQVRVSAPIFMR